MSNKRDLVSFISHEYVESDAVDINGLTANDFLKMTDLLEAIKASKQSIAFIRRPTLAVQVVGGQLSAQSSPYQTTEYWIGPHIGTVWQLASDLEFQNIVEEATVTTGDLYSYTFSTTTPGDYYVRVKYTSDPEHGLWSNIEPVTL